MYETMTEEEASYTSHLDRDGGLGWLTQSTLGRPGGGQWSVVYNVVPLVWDVQTLSSACSMAGITNKE